MKLSLFFFAKARGLFGLIISTVSLPDIFYNKSLMSGFLPNSPPSLTFIHFVPGSCWPYSLAFRLSFGGPRKLEGVSGLCIMLSKGSLPEDIL